LPAADGSQVTALNAGNVSSGTLANGRLSANVTLQGNTFNGATQLVQLDGTSRLPAADGSQVTALNAGNVSTGTLANGRLSANVTLQGNTFNGGGGCDENGQGG
jgi:hypothetical protein